MPDSMEPTGTSVDLLDVYPTWRELRGDLSLSDASLASLLIKSWRDTKYEDKNTNVKTPVETRSVACEAIPQQRHRKVTLAKTFTIKDEVCSDDGVTLDMPVDESDLEDAQIKHNDLQMKLRQRYKTPRYKMEDSGEDEEDDIKFPAMDVQESFDTVEDLFSCDICEYTCSTQAKHKLHQLKHKPRKKKGKGGRKTKPRKIEPFICQICGDVFKESDNLESHMTSHDAVPFTCSACTHTFVTYHEYGVHMISSHEEMQPFTCKTCTKRFPDFVSFCIHRWREHTGDKPYTCSKCPESFCDPSELSEHATTHTPENTTNSKQSLECEVCGKTFCRPLRLKTHMLTHSKSHGQGCPTLNMCYVCGDTFPDRAELKSHVGSHGEEPFQCDICPDSFKSVDDFKEHMATTHGQDKPFHCADCVLRFTKVSALSIHRRRTHTGVKPFKCLQCEQAFFEYVALRRHESTHGRAMPHSCSTCNKPFYSKAALKAHELIHSDSRPWKCDVCNKSYRCKSDLKRHMVTHTGAKPYVCPQCGVHTTNLRSHIKLHSSVLEFTCEICGKGFRQRAGLDVHLKHHLNQKNHVCRFCQKAFVLKVDLETHERTHTGEKPFVCDHCGKAFSDHRTMARHRRIHTRDKLYTCDICSRQFTDHGNFRKHQKVHIKEGKIPSNVSTSRALGVNEINQNQGQVQVPFQGQNMASDNQIQPMQPMQIQPARYQPQLLGHNAISPVPQGHPYPASYEQISYRPNYQTLEQDYQGQGQLMPPDGDKLNPGNISGIISDDERDFYRQLTVHSVQDQGDIHPVGGIIPQDLSQKLL